MAQFFGLSHVDIAVTDLVRALTIYEKCLGFSVIQQGEGFADLDATPIKIRLVATRKPEARAAVRIQSPQVEAGIDALIATGCALLYPATRTPLQELAGSVRDPDGNIITVWRELSEDEYDFVPALPKELSWTEDAEALLQSLLKSVPALFRALARYRVTREAEALAARTRVVSREEVIRGFILASPKVTRARNRKPLIDNGIDADKYQADWDAD
jgi:catechol 2,3-dioxygenase-like lactoylglutathione lyase family enzyme